MPRSCSVFGCPLSNVKRMKTRFCGLFSLPSEPVLRQKWLDKIPNDVSKLKNPYVCLNHFKESDVISKDTFRVGGKEIEIPRYRFKLEKGAIPRFFGNEIENHAASKSKRKRMAGNKILRREPVSAKQGLKLQRKRDLKHKLNKLQDAHKPALSRTQSASEVLKKRKKEKVQNPLQSEDLKQDCYTEAISVIVKEEPMDFKEELDLPAFVTVKEELNEAEREEEEKAALLEVNPLEDTPPEQFMSLDEHMMQEVVDVQDISSRLYLKEGMMPVVKVEGVNPLEDNPPMQYRAVKEEDLMLEAGPPGGPPGQQCGAWRAPLGPLWAFSAAQEAAFAGALRLLLDAGFRLDTVEVRHKAFQFAEAERLPHSFCRKTQTAGALFLDYFLRRHPDVAASLATPRPPLDIPRLPRRRVWSVSELTFPIDRPEMLGRPRAVGDTTRKGEMATVVACADAAGRFLPPLVLLRQPAGGCAAVAASEQAMAQAKNAARACARALPPGSAAGLSPAGVLTEAAFEHWLLHFERHRRPRGGRCLLLLSEHAAHKSLGAVAAYARQRLALRALHQPPPLHHAFVPALRRHYAAALLAHEQQRNRGSTGAGHAAGPVDQASFGAVLAAAWKQAATASNAIEGFQAVGLQDWNLTYDSDGSGDESDDAVENIDFKVVKQELG